MKRVFYLLMALLFSVASYAQSEPMEHFAFKGIPIDGHLADFGQKLVADGFVINEKTDEIMELNGEFGGVAGCRVVVFTTPKTKQVYSVMVLFPTMDTWYSLKSDYKEYKSILTAKYGKPSSSVERFADPYYEGDGYELQALRLNKASYATFFHTENGSVTVALSHMDGARLALVYDDKQNEALNESESNSIKYSDF